MNLSKRDGSSFLSIRILSIVLMVVGVLGLSTIMVYSRINKQVTLLDDGIKTHINTTKKTVKEVLDAKNIKLYEKDSISPSPDTVLTDGLLIDIKRAIPITLVVGGAEKKIFTTKETVQQVLDENQIILSENDKLNIEPTQKVAKNMLLRLIKVRQDTVVEREQVAFRVDERQSTQISRGSKRVIRNGTEGQKEKTYKVVYEDNNIVSKELIKEKLVKKPVNAVMEVGVEPRVVVSRGESLRFSRAITMQASAYTAGYESTGKRPGDRGYGRTATGMTAQRGVVAVDPRVIPLGTKLYIESTDGHSSYGYAVAADVGSSIKGNKIDLFYESLSDALRFGRRTVKVYVLE